MAEEIVFINVEDLEIDPANVRGGEWDRDQDLVRDIKKNGISSALLVRPAGPNSEKKYGIVYGSRRYHAAKEAGLTTVPCIKKEMNNFRAMGRSITENKHRNDIPAWRYTSRIGEMYEELKLEGRKSEIVKMIMEEIGFAEKTVYDYLSMSKLPAEIIELMKKPIDRSRKIKELLSEFTVVTAGGKLSYDKAVAISRQLVPSYPSEKIFEVAAYVIPLEKEAALGIIKSAKTYPQKSMKELHEIIARIPSGGKCSFEFSSDTAMAADRACGDRRTNKSNLGLHYFEEGLRRDGYLEEEKITNGQKKVD